MEAKERRHKKSRAIKVGGRKIQCRDVERQNEVESDKQGGLRRKGEKDMKGQKETGKKATGGSQRQNRKSWTAGRK